jgi:hypothetical protein
MLSLFVSSALLFSAPGHAGDDCDARKLSGAVAKEPSLAAAKLFVDLAACDAKVANRIAVDAMPRFIGGPEGNAALVAALEVGAGDAAIAWVDSLQSDERARAVDALGKACPESEAVRGFFVERKEALGADFWSQRWYRALANCPNEDMQAILWSALEESPDADRTRWFAVLETASRGSGAAALPKLGALLAGTEDPEVQSNVVAAFADASGVGGMDGVNAKASKASVAAIVEAAPSLSVKAVEQARITVGALGDEASANSLVVVRHKDLATEEGRLLWGVVVVEDAQCKKGKQRWQRATIAQAWDVGVTWGDQVRAKVEAAGPGTWPLDLADKCKATDSSVEYLISNAPFKDVAALETWADKVWSKKKASDAKKVIVIRSPDASNLSL